MTRKMMAAALKLMLPLSLPGLSGSAPLDSLMMGMPLKYHVDDADSL